MGPLGCNEHVIGVLDTPLLQLPDHHSTSARKDAVVLDNDLLRSLVVEAVHPRTSIDDHRAQGKEIHQAEAAAQGQGCVGAIVVPLGDVAKRQSLLDLRIVDESLYMSK